MNKGFKNIRFPLTGTYHTDSEHPPLELYLNILPLAKTMDLELGFFSSAVFSVLSFGMAQFIQNGGVLRIITNRMLSDKDTDLIFAKDSEYYDQKDIVHLVNDPNKLEDLQKVLAKRKQHFFNCLLYLKKHDRLIIQPIQPKNSKFGIAHSKICVVSDGENELYFSGSANFTGAALLENTESIDIFPDWKEDIATNKAKIKSFKKRFENLINKNHSGYNYLNESEIEKIIYDNPTEKGLDELLEEEAKLELTNDEKLTPSFKRIFSKKRKEFQDKIHSIINEPKFPYPSGPREYQTEAYNKWVKNDRKGIFAMATGTGKTLTSLNCLLQDYVINGAYKAVIIVPTIALVNQWKKECKKFNFQNVVSISSREKWGRKMSFYNTAGNFISTNFIIIVTYASFYRKKFQTHFKSLDSDTLLIADEAHNFGAGKVSTTLENIHLQKRIGLSATINRKYDDLGNNKIQEFFNDKPPYVYEYTMQMALDNNWLTHYKYYPHIVELDDDEFKEYIRFSKKLMIYFDASTGKYKDIPEVESLLLARKRIIHKAKNKISVFRKILDEEYSNRGNLKYTLIYVPEGMDPDYTSVDEQDEAEDDMRLINQYTKEVSNVSFDVMVKQYVSKSKNKEAVLNDFASGKLDVLTSMKCLDEGVDVPRSELAIFCSSTGNPRQFIQRRGRVLRLADGKNMATIHDLVVVPKVEKNENYYNMERGLIKKELARVVDFAFMAINKQDTFQVFEDLLGYYNLNLNTINEEIN